MKSPCLAHEPCRLLAVDNLRALIGDTIVQTKCLQEEIEQFYPTGQNLGRAAPCIAQSAGRSSEAGEQGTEKLPEIGIGIEHRHDGQGGDGEEGEGVAGAGWHGGIHQIVGAAVRHF